MSNFIFLFVKQTTDNIIMINNNQYNFINRNVRAEQTERYIQALQWILFYYYRGVPSWSWFYEFHYR